ncbi:MAG TPA: S53 family peptidase [Caulobacteraceae bacterium]|nr:S53 family peptidase [Caulobacteraceae bacterium]
MKRLVSIGLSAAALAFCATGAVSAQSDRAVERSGNVYHVRVCGTPARADEARCHAHIVTDERGRAIPAAGKPAPSVYYVAAQLRRAYNISWTGSQSDTPNGPIVAVVDAYGYSTAEADLARYRSDNGLPVCSTANHCFTKVDQNGGTNYPADNTGWAQETALDIQMVSAICPNCRILLVQADTNDFDNLGAAVNQAVSMGAIVVSNSYGASEGSYAVAANSYYYHPGVAITVSSGDNGYGVQFPASSQYVTAVGGTSLKLDSNGNYSSESAWSGAGSGCSALFAKQPWQSDSCSNRMVADVSAVADPKTGVKVFAPYGGTSTYLIFGGTSVAAPIIAGVYGAHGGTFTFGSDPYLNGGTLNDVTTGSNGRCRGVPAYYCNAVTGYDGPTGKGSPNGVSAF